jgi:hypothetical protein
VGEPVVYLAATLAQAETRRPDIVPCTTCLGECSSMRRAFISPAFQCLGIVRRRVSRNLLLDPGDSFALKPIKLRDLFVCLVHPCPAPSGAVTIAKLRLAAIVLAASKTILGGLTCTVSPSFLYAA